MLLTIAAGNSKLSLGEPSTTFGNSTSNGFSSGSRNASTSMAEHAKSLFFEGGGRPVSVDRGGYCKPLLRPSAPHVLIVTVMGIAGQRTPLDSKIIYSGRHEGLAFYFARLIRAIWKSKITLLLYAPAPLHWFTADSLGADVNGCRGRPTVENKTRQVSNVSEAVLTSTQRDLAALRTFVEQ